MWKQAQLGDIAGSVPNYCNRVNHNLFTGGGPCLEFVQKVTPVKHNKAKYNKTRYACILRVSLYSRKHLLLLIRPFVHYFQSTVRP